MMKNRVALFIALVFIFAVVGLQASSQPAYWTVKPLNYDPAHQYSGLCGDGQCFVRDLNSNGENCEKADECYCINNAEYLADDLEYSGDNYCSNGNWTTRTKQVANTLATFAKSAQGSPNSFSLYCDIPENAVFNGFLPDEFPEQNFNNFCVLKYGANIGIGTSLNGVALNQETLNSMGLGITGYAACSGPGDWQKCGSVWLNPSLNATIWLSSQPNSLTASNNQLQALFDAIKSFFTGKPVPPAIPSDIVTKMLSSTSSFDTVYLAKAGNRQIFAYLEQKHVNYEGINLPYTSIAGEYQNLDFAFCDSLENYCAAGSCSYLCEPAAATSSFRIYHIGATPTLMEEVWQDLTSKLRLKSG